MSGSPPRANDILEKLVYYRSYKTWLFRSGYPQNIWRGAADRKKEHGGKCSFRSGHPQKMRCSQHRLDI
eukprot:1952507-Pyramimonas_sp.AAC.1